MATRAEQAKAETQRAAQSKNRTTRAKKLTPARAVKEAKRDTSGRDAGGVTAARNVKVPHGNGDMSMTLEDSANGKATRKSTRKSQSHIKPDTQLELRQKRRVRAPETQARRAVATKTRRASRVAAA